jgi:thymidine phosphorylase
MVDTPASALTGSAKLSRLRLRPVGIDTYHENVAYLHRDCEVYRAEGFKALSKIELHLNGHSILATLNVVDDTRIVDCGEVGLSKSAYLQLRQLVCPPSALPPSGGAEEEAVMVTIGQAEPPASMGALHRKIMGERMTQADLQAIVQDIAQHQLSKIELSAFLVATNRDELDREEVFFLTQAMVAAGRRLDWHEAMVVDKHCIGGIPGNRTSMLVVPIVAAHGLLCPKTSSRAITSPAGTADTMEVLAKVELPIDELHDIVRRHRACLAWGGTANLSPADDVLISVERPLSLDAPGQMVASILSKKIAAGSTHLVLDIPIGPSAKVRSMPEAQRLRRLFEYVADRMNLAIDVVITDGRQPIGLGIGPVLEARDVMKVLENDPAAPMDLRQKALRLAGRMIEFDPDVRGGDGFAIARDILDSGRALAKMNDLIQAQGSRHFDHHRPVLAPLCIEVQAQRSGMVTGIDNLQLARIARLAGAPKVSNAGVDLCHQLGSEVQAGEVLYRVYAAYPADLAFAQQAVNKFDGYTLGEAVDLPHVFVEF